MRAVHESEEEEMNRNDIIGMAYEAEIKAISPKDWLCTLEKLERFAALIAAAEREACIKALEENEQFYCRDTIRARGEK